MQTQTIIIFMNIWISLKLSILFKCPVHRKMQTSHVALKRFTFILSERKDRDPVNSLLEFQCVYHIKPRAFPSKCKAFLGDFSAFTDRLNIQDESMCFALSWLCSMAVFIKLLHSTSVLKDGCVTWKPFTESHWILLCPSN